MALKALLTDFDRYWFSRGSAASFGIFRILIGFLWFCNLLMLAPCWYDWFGEHGFVPREAARRYLGGPTPTGLGFGVPPLDLLAGVSDDRIAIAFFALVTLAALATCLGVASRVSTVVLALGAVSLQHRNAIILHGGDSVLRICAIYLAVGPSGACCSIDRLLRIWRGREGLEPRAVYVWPQRVVAYNVALIYLTTVWVKWQGNLWRNGTATWYTARLQEFRRFPVPSFLNDRPMIYLTTWSTLAVEFALGTLVFFRPLRKYVLLAGILMHGYIEYSMNVPLFAFSICSMYICFYDGEEVAAWAQKVGRRMVRLHVTVRVPHALSPRSVALLEAVDPFKLVTYLPGESLSAQDARGRSLDPYRAILSRSVGTWVIAWVPVVVRRLLAAVLRPVGQPDQAPQYVNTATP